VFNRYGWLFFRGEGGIVLGPLDGIGKGFISLLDLEKDLRFSCGFVLIWMQPLSSFQVCSLDFFLGSTASYTQNGVVI
jgi:hypothetical protein